MTSSKGPPRRRRGRRAGGEDTRGLILTVAREAFARNGVEAVSVRGVAGAAGVDEGLVRHYFGDKTGLVLAAVSLQLDPRELIDRVASSGTQGLGPRIIATALTLYASPLGAAARAAVLANPGAARVLLQLLTAQIERNAEHLLPDVPAAERHERIAVIQTVMSGLALSRLLVNVGPVADLPDERVVEILGPVVQAAIDGRLTRPQPPR